MHKPFQGDFYTRLDQLAPAFSTQDFNIFYSKNLIVQSPNKIINHLKLT
jgi:hypothetical protein